MLRLVPALVFLAACTEPGSADGFRNRRPAMRTTDYGFVHTLQHPYEQGLRQLRAVAGDDLLALVGRDDRCHVVRIHTREDARQGVRSPRQELRSCGDDTGRVAYADGLLVVDRMLYRRDADGVSEAGAVPLRPDLAMLDVAVLDADTVAFLVEGTVHVFGFDGTGWEETARIAVEGEDLVTDGTRIAVGHTVHEEDAGAWIPILETAAPITDLQGDRVATASTSSFRLLDLTTGERLTAGSDQLQLTPFGHAVYRGGDSYFGRSSTLTLHAPDGTVVSTEEVTTRATIASGGTSLVYFDEQRDLRWIELTDGRPEGRELLATSATVARGTWERHTIQVPPDADTLTVRLEGTGDADLYVAYDTPPSLAFYDCSPYRAGSDEICEIPHPAAGTWHLGVHGFAAGSQVTLQALVE